MRTIIPAILAMTATPALAQEKCFPIDAPSSRVTFEVLSSGWTRYRLTDDKGVSRIGGSIPPTWQCVTFQGDTWRIAQGRPVPNFSVGVPVVQPSPGADYNRGWNDALAAVKLPEVRK